MSLNQSAVREATPEVRAKTIDHTCTGVRLSARRLQAHALTSVALGEAVRVSGASFGEVARALEMSATRAADFADPDHPAALTLRDVRAMGEGGARGVAIALLRGELEDLEDAPPPSRLGPERHALRLGSGIGTLQSGVEMALADGELSADEREELLRELAALERAITAMRRDLEAGR